jgi:peptidoglycan/LPS O-acetylase OafA/YrhL
MRDPRVETLRGIACLLLVTYHVVGADPGGGLRIADGSLRLLNDAMAYLRMPLFTFLSGIVYGLRPFDGDSHRFIAMKFRRLVVPVLVVGTIFAVLRSVIPGTRGEVTNWWLLHVEPVAHYWFAESLFWVFLWVWGLERYRALLTPFRFATVVIGSALLYLNVFGLWWFSIDGAVYLLPYFLLGLAVTRFRLWVKIADRRIWPVVLAIAVFAAWHLGRPTPVPNVRTEWALAAGVALCILCLVPQARIGWLMRIGSASYAIYLFHVFFTAATRIALEQVGLAIVPIELIVGVMAGLLGPMAIQRMASRNRWTAMLLLGMSRSRHVQRDGANGRQSVPLASQDNSPAN